MDKQNAKCDIYPNNEIVTKMNEILKCCNMDEPQKHSEWKKPDTKGHILYNPIYMKYL